MKTVVLMRHAKAVGESPDGRDFSRGLADKGRGRAALTAEVLRDAGVNVHRILTSSAARTVETTEVVAPILCPDAVVIPVNELYLAPGPTYVSVLHRMADEDEEGVLFVGHNPGIAWLMTQLAGMVLEVPTATATVFQCSCDSWKDITLERSADVQLQHVVLRGELHSPTP
ncbi:MAG: histidine phosphatase family protein [Planctomycetaceae bacterium]|nr:histidine phosphatase family protein [Planctomycetaceae bacterium]